VSEVAVTEPDELNEARALIVKGDADQAIQKLSEFLNGDFFHDEALFMLGACLLAKGLNGLGAVVTSAAIDARASRGKAFPEALLNLGAAYKAEHANELAERIWNDALKHETVPRERAKILTNIASLYVNEGCPEKAIPYCDRALREDPYNAGAKANRGMASLELGRWREGWEGWSATFASGDRVRKVYRHGTREIPAWDGSPDKTVIVYGDQGIGDEIFYAAVLGDMQRFSRRLILDCHPRLTGLFKRSLPDIEVHGTRKDLTELDWIEGCDAEAAVCLADLPGHFRNEGEWDGKPYMKAAEIKRKPGLRIGLSWTGGSKKTRTALRSLPLAALEPILRAKSDAQWFSLQYTPNAAREVCELEERTGIRISHYPGWVECFDYDRTASFVGSLDLVITVCTTIHHLGGSLGVPTWTLVPKRASWRYGVSGETLPWYGSAKLFRQETDGDWSGPIERIARQLADL